MSFARAGLFALTLAACDWGAQYCEADWAAVPPEAEPPRATARTVAQVLPVDSSAVDILFVIDDSSSMGDEQKQLGIWASTLFEVLSGTGELPDLHIAVTSSSVAIPGIPQCSGAGGRFHLGGTELQGARFIRDVAGPEGRERNYTGELTEAFAKLARVGDGGCGFEQPFKAARMLLSTSSKDEERFLRDDALLLVVFVTDEDDCSATDPALFGDPYADACTELGTITSYRCFEHGVRCYDGKGSREFGERSNCRPDESGRWEEPVSKFAAFLKGLKRDPAQVVVAAIYGKPNGVFAVPDERILTHETPRLADVCGSHGVEGTGATPAIRMNGLLAEFGGRASQSSICESELSWAMRDIGKVTRSAATRSRCLGGPLVDVDALAPGIQPTCRVEGASKVGTYVERHTQVPPCRGAERAGCFTIDTDATCAETQLSFRVFGAAADETLLIACDVDDAE